MEWLRFHLVNLSLGMCGIFLDPPYAPPTRPFFRRPCDVSSLSAVESDHPSLRDIFCYRDKFFFLRRCSHDKRTTAWTSAGLRSRAKIASFASGNVRCVLLAFYVRARQQRAAGNNHERVTFLGGTCGQVSFDQLALSHWR